ncbi:MAG: serine/threonine protein kinase [Planctomycetales bacterium]|nr:serine/threonine protein kinase [Planctomycetales bacterium]
MIAPSHYDRSVLARFLTASEDNCPHDIAAHVENCEECQLALEGMINDGLTMKEAGRLLQQNSSAAAIPAGTGDDPPAELQQLSFLEPSVNSEALGMFGRYEILRVLGRGGMGVVMQAFDPVLDRSCAVKVLAPELASSAAARQRFFREAKSAAAVVHPHVIPIQTVDEQRGLPYLVMPVIEGRSLQQRVDELGLLDGIEVVRIAMQIASGLSAAHAQGLVHRDIKPANILLENGVERVQITDFGLARAVDDASVTRSGVISGTPQYMSPEQARGESIDHRSDLFSLGSVMYFMLVGRSPFRAETTMGVLDRINNDEPRSPREVRSEIPEWLEAIVLRCLQKDPNKRFQSASELFELLESALAHLQKPCSVPAPATKNLSKRSVGSHGRIRNWKRWLIGSLLGAFAIWAASVILLETGNGVLKIESHADHDIPIVIRRGNEIVKNLLVTKEGTTTKLRAGFYTLEIDDEETEYTFEDEQLRLSRGGELVATISLQSETTQLEVAELDAEDYAKLFFELVRKGNIRRAMDMLSEDRNPSFGEGRLRQTSELLAKETSDSPKLAIAEDRAYAVFKPLRFEPAHEDVGEAGCPVLWLVRENDRWWIKDMDIQAEKHAVQQLAEWEVTTEAEKLRPADWGGSLRGYEFFRDSETKRSGQASARLTRTGDSPSPKFGTIVQAIDARRLTGKRIRYTGYIKTDDVRDHAALWLRVDSVSRGTVAIDNMQKRQIRGTNDWQQYEIVLDVPEDGALIHFGALLAGDGTIWVDDLSLEVVSDKVPLTARPIRPTKQEVSIPAGISPVPKNLSFEQ